MTDIWWYFAGFILMALVVGFGALNLLWSIRELQRRVASLTKLPPERIKYVVVYEKEANLIDDGRGTKGNETG
jgi:hypothetical protein